MLIYFRYPLESNITDMALRNINITVNTFWQD